MILKDIINRKIINDELFLLKTNVKSLILSWRITRTPYFLSILLVYLSYISMPAKLLEPVILLNLSTEYEEGIISFIGFILQNIFLKLSHTKKRGGFNA